jgi:2-C-methyl-D-erythritol 4-phosphate cytidylyltransferase
MKVIVIIPAAGLGTRMASKAAAKGSKGKTPPSKQFTELAGTPILIRTLRQFAGVEQVNEIWIALRENEIAAFRARLQGEAKDVLKKKVELVVGGEHRQQSVESALNSLKASADDIVLVHDAVRPFVTSEIIQDCDGTDSTRLSLWRSKEGLRRGLSRRICRHG